MSSGEGVEFVEFVELDVVILNVGESDVVGMTVGDESVVGIVQDSMQRPVPLHGKSELCKTQWPFS